MQPVRLLGCVLLSASACSFEASHGRLQGIAVQLPLHMAPLLQCSPGTGLQTCCGMCRSEGRDKEKKHKHKEKDKSKEKEKDREPEKDRDRDRETDRERERDQEREREAEKQRDRDREKARDRDRDRRDKTPSKDRRDRSSDRDARRGPSKYEDRGRDRGLSSDRNRSVTPHLNGSSAPAPALCIMYTCRAHHVLQLPPSCPVAVTHDT